MIYLKRRLLIKRHKRRFFLDTRHLMEEREEKPRAGHRLPMMRNRNGRLLMAMVHVSPVRRRQREFGGEGVTENGDFRDRSLLEDDGDPCL